MAVGAPGGNDGGGFVTGPVKGRLTRTSIGRDQQWLLTLLPAFPVLLLVLRLWYLSRQDLQTMLLLVQYVSPLGLLSALLLTLVWVPSLIILVARMLGALLWLSESSEVRAMESWLVRLTMRMPDWVVALAVLLAALSWQLRFLPTLVLLTLAIVGLVIRGRWPEERRRVRVACLVLPLVMGAATYAWVLPSGIAAVRAGETVTALLLLLPPAVAVLLTGPLPAVAARPVTHWTAMVLALLAPFVIGAVFLRAPVLPVAALEIDAGSDTGRTAGSGSDTGRTTGPDAGRPASTVVRAHVIAVDERVTTLLDMSGQVRFVPNADVLSQTMCPGTEPGPSSRIDVHGWHVEQSALEWLAPPRPRVSADPRCQGRPLRPR